MKLTFVLLIHLAILESVVKCHLVESHSRDILTMSNEGKPESHDLLVKTDTRVADQERLHRVKRRFKNPLKKVGNWPKSKVPIVSKAIKTSHFRPSNGIVSKFLSKLHIPSSNLNSKKFSSKFLDYTQKALSGSASARAALKSSLSTLLGMGSQGASMAASIAQVLALTKPIQNVPAVISQKDDLTPLLLALIRPVDNGMKENSGSYVTQSSLLVSLLTVFVCKFLSQ